MEHTETVIVKDIPKKPRATIGNLSHDGRGIAHIDGKTTFVFGALPGEDVSISYTNTRSKFDEGAVDEIFISSPERVTPGCKFFGKCGGCSLQHLDQLSQITFKQSVLIEQLKHFGGVTPKTILPPLMANAYGYRRKARYSVKYVEKKQRVLIGFRELHFPRFLADIDSCQVLHPNIGNLITPLQECLSDLDNRKHIAQIEVAVGDNATALIFRHLDSLTDSDHTKFVQFAQAHNVWVYLQPGGYNTIHRIYPSLTLSSEDNYLTYKITNDITLYFHPCDFTQVNAEINRQMIQQAINLLDIKEDDILLDLFCGIGNFSLPMATHACQVVGIEGDRHLVERASMNATRNSIQNARFLCADLNKVEELPKIIPGTKFNKVLIDPPRSGARAIVENMPLTNIEKIVYVSCNPATLARDAGILAKRGFELTHVGVMDMFTHTEHVEAMAVFTQV